MNLQMILKILKQGSWLTANLFDLWHNLFLTSPLLFLNCKKRNEGIYNNDISEHEEVPLEDVKQAEHANHTNSEDPIVLTQLMISSENNIQ